MSLISNPINKYIYKKCDLPLGFSFLQLNQVLSLKDDLAPKVTLTNKDKALALENT